MRTARINVSKNHRSHITAHTVAGTKTHIGRGKEERGERTRKGRKKAKVGEVTKGGRNPVAPKPTTTGPNKPKTQHIIPSESNHHHLSRHCTHQHGLGKDQYNALDLEEYVQSPIPSAPSSRFVCGHIGGAPRRTLSCGHWGRSKHTLYRDGQGDCGPMALRDGFGEEGLAEPGLPASSSRFVCGHLGMPLVAPSVVGFGGSHQHKHWHHHQSHSSINNQSMNTINLRTNTLLRETCCRRWNQWRRRGRLG